MFLSASINFISYFGCYPTFHTLMSVRRKDFLSYEAIFRIFYLELNSCTSNVDSHESRSNELVFENLLQSNVYLNDARRSFISESIVSHKIIAMDIVET